MGLQQSSRSHFLWGQKTKPLQPVPGETGAEQTPRVTVSNGLPALPAANPNEPLSVLVACISVCVWFYSEELFPVLCKLEPLLQVVFSAVCSSALRCWRVDRGHGLWDTSPTRWIHPCPFWLPSVHESQSLLKDMICCWWKYHSAIEHQRVREVGDAYLWMAAS